MPAPWENDGNDVPQHLVDLGFIALTSIEGGFQSLWKFKGDPVAWNADDNLEWAAMRLVPGLNFIAKKTGKSLMGWSYAFRIMFPKDAKIEPMFSIALVNNQDRQGAWSIDELISNDLRTVWMNVDEEMIELMKDFDNEP